jgi:hypothetical protein
MENTDLQKILSEVESTPTDMNRIDPKIMSAIMAMAQAGQLARIRKNMEDRTSTGWVQSFQKVITDAPPMDGWWLDKPAQSVSITNDGPNPLLVGFNDNINPAVVNVTDVLVVDFKAHRLNRLYLQCQMTGGTTNVRFILKG